LQSTGRIRSRFGLSLRPLTQLILIAWLRGQLIPFPGTPSILSYLHMELFSQLLPCHSGPHLLCMHRWVRRESLDFPTSPILLKYQANMRGVDVVDQYRHYYTIALQLHKWWHRVLTLVLDSLLLNSFITYRADAEDVGMPVYSRQLWHYTLAKRLVAPFVRPDVARGPARNLEHRGFHSSECHVRARRRCLVCGVRTRQFCPSCGGRFMCLGSCYTHVHTQPQYALLAVV
jgi:hypothetical protein